MKLRSSLIGRLESDYPILTPNCFGEFHIFHMQWDLTLHANRHVQISKMGYEGQRELRLVSDEISLETIVDSST